MQYAGGFSIRQYYGCHGRDYNPDMRAARFVNKDFFKTWTPDMAYVLGFFAADGYVTVNRRGGQYWCIDIADEGLLNKVRAAIGSNHKISIRTRKQKIGTCYSFRLQIGNIEMCSDLHKIGFWQNKTYGLAVPFIPDEYAGDFVRGYFDGDGHVWVGLRNKERLTQSYAIQTVFTSCSLGFLESLHARLADFGIEKGVIRKGKGSYYRLTYSTKGSLKLYDFMYNGLTSPLFLRRKKVVFEKFRKLRL